VHPTARAVRFLLPKNRIASDLFMPELEHTSATVATATDIAPALQLNIYQYQIVTRILDETLVSAIAYSIGQCSNPLTFYEVQCDGNVRNQTRANSWGNPEIYERAPYQTP
jgi:hypothetical protein